MIYFLQDSDSDNAQVVDISSSFESSDDSDIEVLFS